MIFLIFFFFKSHFSPPSLVPRPGSAEGSARAAPRPERPAPAKRGPAPRGCAELPPDPSRPPAASLSSRTYDLIFIFFEFFFSSRLDHHRGLGGWGGPAALPDRPLPIAPKELSWLHGCRQVAVHRAGLSEFASWQPRSYQVSRSPEGAGLRRGAAGLEATPEGVCGVPVGEKGCGECCGAAGKGGIGVLGCAPGSGAGVGASVRGWERFGAGFGSGSARNNTLVCFGSSCRQRAPEPCELRPFVCFLDRAASSEAQQPGFPGKAATRLGTERRCFGRRDRGFRLSSIPKIPAPLHTHFPRALLRRGWTAPRFQSFLSLPLSLAA